MKYLQGLALSAALTSAVIWFSGCMGTSSKEVSAAQKLGSSFTAEMTMTLEDMTASGTISRLGEGQWTVAFVEPSSLAGVVLEFSGDTVSASYQGLNFSVPQSAMPAKSVLTALIQAVDTLAKEETITGEEKDGSICTEGQADGTPYVLTLTEAGELEGFSMEGMDAVLQFCQFQTGAVSIATETTETTELSES